MDQKDIDANEERKARQPIREIINHVRKQVWDGIISEDQVATTTVSLAKELKLVKELIRFAEIFQYNSRVYPPKSSHAALDSINALDSLIAKAGVSLKKEPGN